MAEICQNKTVTKCRGSLMMTVTAGLDLMVFFHDFTTERCHMRCGKGCKGLGNFSIYTNRFFR